MSFRKTILGFVLLLCTSATAYAYDINLLSDIPVKGNISAIAVNTATDVAVTISETDKSLSIIETVTGAVIHEVSIPATPSGVAIQSALNMAIVSSREGNLLYYDLSSGELTKSIDVKTPIYAITVDEAANAVILGVDGGIKIIDLSSGQQLSAVSLPGKTLKICLGKAIITSISQEEKRTMLRLIDAKTGMVSIETLLPGDVASLALDEQLGYILVTLMDNEGLYLYDASSLQQGCQLQTHKKVEIVSVNPSTHMAVLSDTLDGSLSVVDLQTKEIVNTLSLFYKTGPITLDASRNTALVGHGKSLSIVKLENPVPVLTELVPTSVASTGEIFPLSLMGALFIKDSQTFFNKRTVDTFFASNEFVKANIPPDELIYPGNVTVSVFNPTPGGGMSNELAFKVLTPVPVLSTLSPSTVAVGSASFTLKIEGKNFLPAASVTVNGRKAEVRFISSILLETTADASLAAAIGSYPVLVTNPGPTNAISNTVSLKVVTAEEAAALSDKSLAEAASQGTGSLSGRILSTEMQPVREATIRYKNISVQTDDGGNFTLNNIPAGKRTILIDGSTSIDTIGHYPTIPITADILANKKNPMPFSPYLHRQKNRNFVQINPATDTVLTDPELPGFEMRIPKGVNIFGWDGKRNLKVSVRTVPTDRLPVKPLPKNSYVKTVYMFYFNKVGGGKPDRPIPIKSPNNLGLLPGDKAVLWYYDESQYEGEAPNDWAIAGTGTVTPDGRFIVCDPGVGIPKFCCGATAWGGQGKDLPSSGKNGPDESPLAADPVDLATGYFFHEETDLVVPGIIPVEIKRYYRSRDSGSAVTGTTGLGAFGKGMTLSMDWWIGSYGSMLRLTKPGMYQYDFALQPDGSYVNFVDPEFRAAKVTVNGDSTKTLRMGDGKTYKFDASGRLIEIADRNGNKVTIQRHSDYEGGYVSSITTAEGRVITFSQSYTHGTFFQTDVITDNTGRSVKYTYETDPFSSYPRLKEVEQPDGRTIQYGYDSEGRMNTITDGRGNVQITNEYDTSNRVIKQTLADGSIYTFSYTEAGGYLTQTTMTAPNGAQTLWRFNDYTYITDKTTPDGTTTFEKAVGTNELQSITDPLGRVTSYTYYFTNDARNGLVQTVTDPLFNVTSYEYEPTYGLLTKVTDALLKDTTITYTPTGAPPTQAVIKDPLLHETTVTFSAYGMPTSVTDPLQHTTNIGYDSNHHAELTSVTDPLGNKVSYGYDEIGRLTTVTDAKGAITKYGLDPMGRVASVTDAAKNVTMYFYDLNGNLTMLLDPKGNSIHYEYDNRDRIEKMTDQLERYETYAYYTGAQITATTGNNLMSYTDRKGQTTTFDEYDAQNRLKQVTFNDGSHIEYTYDSVGRATHIFDSLSGAIDRVYNDFGCTTCDGRGLDLISQEATPLATIDYTYDKDRRRASMAVAGEPVVSYGYDDAGRLESLSRAIGATNRTYHLGYDDASHRTSLQIPLANGTNYVSTTYGYDNANRLLSMVHQGPSALIENLVYGVDANGNSTSFGRNATQTLSPGVTGTAHNAANEMLGLNGKGFSYDQSGNLETRTDASGTTNYTWDARNRLVAINGPSLSATFSYDAFNRRISKTVNGTTTQFVYDGWDIIQEISAGVKTNYVQTLYLDQPLTRTNSTSTRHYVSDALGSVVALADDTGAKKTTYVYDAYGNVTASGEISDNPLQFTSRENDGTGFYYYRARYYSPEMQRFISEDPIRLWGGMNYFSYVQNNPVNFTDPTGLSYAALSFSHGIAFQGESESGNDVQPFVTSDLFGVSLDLQIGFLPGPEDMSVEVSAGLGHSLGVGAFIGENNSFGIAFHFGLGVPFPSVPGALTLTKPTKRYIFHPPPGNLEIRMPPSRLRGC